MSQLDAQGEAHGALGSVVAGYGQGVLSDPHMLGNLVTDLLPDLPRERSLLVAGAEAGVAAEIRQHVEDQRMDPDTAVQLVARTLSERRAIDPAASMWVAAEYAQALGYRVRPYTAAGQAPPAPSWSPQAPSWSPQGQAPQAPPAQARSWPPAGQPPQGPPAQVWQPGGQQPQRPPGQFWQSPQAPSGPSGQSWPPPGQSWPPAQPGPGGSGGPGRPGSWRSGRKIGVIAGVAVVAAAGIYLGVAAFAHTVPFAKSRTVAATSHARSPHPTTAASSHPKAAPSSTGPALAAGVAPVVQLLPRDVSDPTTQCTASPPPYPWVMNGLVKALDCTDPGLGKGQVLHAFQMDSQADFETTWQNFNTFYGMDSGNPGTHCPPAANGAGRTPFFFDNFPVRTGQVLECQMVATSNNKVEPTYAWAFPSENAFIIAEGVAGSKSYAALDNWWLHNAAPMNAPTPSAS